MNRKRLLIWISGFAILFVFNVIVEFFILPAWNLDNTPRNDIYFQSWWGVVAIWLFFGIPFLKFIERKTS